MRIKASCLSQPDHCPSGPKRVRGEKRNGFSVGGVDAFKGINVLL